MRDPLGTWSPLKPWLAVAGVLPSSHEFALRQAKDAGLANATSVLQSLRLLDVDIEGDHEASPSSPPLFKISDDDLRWVFRSLGLPPSRGRTLLPALLLSRVATALVKMKSRRLIDRMNPELRVIVERRLVSASVPFRAALADFLPRGQNASEGDRMFVLRLLRPGEELRVGVAPLRLSLRAAEDRSRGRSREPKSSGALAAIVRRLEQAERSVRRLEEAERSVRRLEEADERAKVNRG